MFIGFTLISINIVEINKAIYIKTDIFEVENFSNNKEIIIKIEINLVEIS